MAIAETAAVASIIGKLLSMSTDLLERKESREVLTEIREIQKLTIQLHSLYISIETKQSELQSVISNLQTEKSNLEHTILNKEREYDKIHKQLDEWDQYVCEVTPKRFVYFKKKSQLGVYACAVCKGKEPYPMILQPPRGTYDLGTYKCNTCQTIGEIE